MEGASCLDVWITKVFLLRLNTKVFRNTAVVSVYDVFFYKSLQQQNLMVYNKAL